MAVLLHASCAARNGHGVLIVGESGSGKSDLTLRLIHIGFSLVADDQVDVQGPEARAVPALAGLLEVRGLGIVRMPYDLSTTLALAVQLGRGDRLPAPAIHACGVPLVTVDAAAPSAPERVALALECAVGQRTQLVGAFGP